MSNTKPTEKESFRDHLSTVDEESGKRRWIFPTKPKGSYYTKRSIVSFCYYLVFFTLPFIHVKGKPLFLFNIPEAKFVIFGKIFWPQDFLIFGLMTLGGLLFIALFTMIFGRMFCGWICPQTIFMEMLFRRIDYIVLGDGPAQKHLAQSKKSAEKVRKYTIRYILYFLMSFLIANTFLAYIIGIKELQKIITEPISMHLGGLATITVFTLVFFSVFAFLREQVCTNICPYGRLQGVLLDKNTIVVAYDYKRGEPRAKFSKIENLHVGDCIDCNQCVKVCPTGIDIRNGTQLECTNCTACIDACNLIMEKVNKPLSLIRYDSENNIAEKKKFKFTGRILVYSSVLLIILGVITTLLINRSDVGIKLMRAGGLTYQERGTDSLSNLYNIKLENKTTDTMHLTVSLDHPNGKIQMVGQESITLLPESQASSSFFIILPINDIKNRKTELDIKLIRNKEEINSVETTFLAPNKKY